VRAAVGEPAGYGRNPEQGATRWSYPERLAVFFDAGDKVADVKGE